MMITRTPERAVALLGALTATLALMLVVLGVATGGSHAAIRIEPSDAYSARLVARATILRVDVALDFAFMLSYTAFLAALYAMLRRWATPGTTWALWLGALVVSSLLDAVEDAHVLAMLSQAEQGLVVPTAEISAQMLITELKLVTSYAGLMMLSFALPEGTRLERAVISFLRWIHPALGIAVLVIPAVWARPLLLLRFAGLIGSLWAFVAIARARSRDASAGC